MSKQPGKSGHLSGAIFMGLFGLAFAGFATFAFFGLIRQGHNGDGGPLGPALALCGVFIAIGVAIMAGAIYAYRHGQRDAVLAAQHPDQPWLLKKAWAEGRITDSTRAGFFGMLFFALVWNGISWAATIGAFREGSQAEEGARWLVLLFPAVGLLLAGMAVYQFLRWRKFGTSVFELAEVPGVIGGNLGGVVLTSVKVRPEKGFLVSLRCLRITTSGSGKNRSTHTTTIWESEQWIEQDAFADDPRQTALPIFFGIPYDCQPTDSEGASRIQWELKAKAELPGVDYESRFEVPVFRTPASDPSFDAQAARQATDAPTSPQETPENWVRAGLIVRDDLSGATLVETRTGRHAGFLFFPLLIGIGMLVGAWFAWQRSDMPLIFPIAFAGFGLLVTLGIGGSLFTSLRLKIFPDRLESESRFFGITRRRSINTANIRAFDCKSTMSSGEVRFYDIIAHLEDGTQVSLPFRLRGESRARALIALIESKLNGGPARN